MSKPQLTPRDEKGRFGVAYVRSVIETGWRSILQDFEGTNDRGLDGVVLDVHLGHVTSIQFNLQIKTSTFTRDHSGETFPAPVDRKHLKLWADSDAPVVLVCVDYSSPPSAFWRLIRPDEENLPIHVSRRNIFGPASRDNVVTAIRDAFPKQASPILGKTLSVPLNKGIRDVAKDYYYKNLLGKPQDNPVFGPIEFTWKGWRHLTRRGRAMYNVANSLLLLPCVRSVVGPGAFPAKWRPLPTIHRGNQEQHRTLLVFDRIATFQHRVPALVRVVVERQALIPADWAVSVPDDYRRVLRYKFLTVYELTGPLALREVGSTGR